MAWEGSNVMATDLDDEYSNDNVQYLLTPEIEITDNGRMRMVSYQRMLAVEDAFWDQARVSINGMEVWRNLWTSGGGTHHIDTDWTLHDIPLDDFLDDSGTGTVSVMWDLSSDTGLEFYGWALDSVCVVELADVPGHYRVRNLNASDDEDTVTITWEQPWIDPLAETVLVRNREAVPTGPDDGVVIAYDKNPIYGETITAEDPEVLPGEQAWYAVFTADDDGYYLDAVEGENVDQGGVPSPPGPDDTAQPEDTGIVDETGPGRTLEGWDDASSDGCGCASTGRSRSTLALLFGMILLGLRHRRVQQTNGQPSETT